MCQTGMIDHQAEDGPWLDWCAPLAAPAAPLWSCPDAVLRLQACPCTAHVGQPWPLLSATTVPTRHGCADHLLPPSDAPCRAQSQDECPKYTNLSLQLLSHARLPRLHNPCGDPTPDEGSPGESPQLDSAPQGDAPPDDLQVLAPGPGQDPAQSPPVPTNERKIKPFTPGRQ